MSDINDLLGMLPATARFFPGGDDRASYDEALRRGWQVQDLADAILEAIQAPNVRVKATVARVVLDRLCAQPPPPVRKPVDNTRGVGLPMPECAHCGQPYGRKGGVRPQLGQFNRTCTACGESLELVQYRRQEIKP